MFEILAHPLALSGLILGAILLDRSEVALAFLFSGLTYTILAPFFGFHPAIHLSVVGLFIVAAEFARVVLIQKRGLNAEPASLWMAGLVLSLTVAWIWSPPPPGVFSKWVLFGLNAAVPFAYFSLIPHSKDRLVRFFVFYSIFSILGSLALFPTHFRNPEMVLLEDANLYRAEGRTLIRNNILLARIIGHSMIIALGAGFFVFRNQAWRIVFAGVAAVLALELIVVNQRGPLYGLVPVISTWILIPPVRIRSTNRLPRALGISALGLLLLYSVRLSFERFYFRLGEGIGSPHRLRIFAEAFEGFIQHPVFGWGFGGATTELQESSAHNILLQVTMEGGLVAITFFLVTFLQPIWKAWRLRARIFEERVRTVTVLSWTLFFYDFLQGLISGDLNTNSAIWVWLGFGLALFWSSRRDSFPGDRFDLASDLPTPNGDADPQHGSAGDPTPLQPLQG